MSFKLWITQRGFLPARKRAILNLYEEKLGSKMFWKLDPTENLFPYVKLRKRVVVWPFFETLSSTMILEDASISRDRYQQYIDKTYSNYKFSQQKLSIANKSWRIPDDAKDSVVAAVEKAIR